MPTHASVAPVLSLHEIFSINRLVVLLLPQEKYGTKKHTDRHQTDVLSLFAMDAASVISHDYWHFNSGLALLTVALHMGVISDPTVDATISPVLNNIVPNGSMTL